MLRRGGAPMDVVRGAARRALFAARPGWQRWILRVLMTLAWPVGAGGQVLRWLRRLPPGDRPSGLAGWWRRGLDMWWLAMAENVPPREYVAYGLHHAARRDWIGQCLYLPEARSLLPWLNRRNGAHNDDVQDKARFAALCAAHDLPCIATLAVYAGGRQVWPDGAPFLPDQPALWVKDLAGSRGSGGRGWRRDGNHYGPDAGDRLDNVNAGDRLLAPWQLVEEWRRRDCLVQPLVENHPDLAPLSDGGLVDFRVVTGIGRDGAVEVVAVLGHLPCGGAAARRHILGAVDVQCGRITAPFAPDGRPLSRHPDTQADIAAVSVPFWPEVLALAVRAHGIVPQFARFVFLGWDVAVTVDGPILVETNSGWGAFNHQAGTGQPLGRTRFAAIALPYLRTEQWEVGQ